MDNLIHNRLNNVPRARSANGKGISRFGTTNSFSVYCS
jgi:hypothetical protein